MKTEKKLFNIMLTKWMRWDADLHTHLTDLQIKILHERIVEEQTFIQMAARYKSSPRKIKIVFLATLFRVNKKLGTALFDLLNGINSQIELREAGIYKDTDSIDYCTLFLN